MPVFTSFELFVARRYLRAKRRQAVIGVITTISVIGVAAGVASLIVALAITNGFRQDLQSRLLGATAHVQLMRTAGDGIGVSAGTGDWRDLLARMQKLPHVVAAAPAMYDQVLVSRGARASGALLKGLIPQDERTVSEMLSFVKQGSAAPLSPEASPPSPAGGPLNPSSGLSGADHPNRPQLPPIVLGKDMADDLGAAVGSVVLVTSPQGGGLTPFSLAPKFVSFKVVGIFESGFYDYDKSWGFIRLSDAQSVEGLGDVISVVEFKVDNIDQAPEIAREIEHAAGEGYQTTNWQEQNRQLFRALRLERVVTFITIGLIVLVAALNILISLIMMVMEKTRDIAVLMSMGTRKAQIRRLFMAQGLLIGVIGTAIGLVIGYALAWAGGHYRFISLSPEVYSIDYVPFAPRVTDGVIVAVVSIGISFVATLYPSWSASRIAPAEALRYE
jgi:lipoprotein-releasing system permease protein